MRTSTLALLLSLAVAASGCGSTTCSRACSKLKRCAGDASASGTESCPFDSACSSPKDACLADCINAASCEALSGASLAEAAQLEACRLTCEQTTYPEAGVEAGVADSSPQSCTSPAVRCGSDCVDLATSPANCGTCGHACGSSELCVAGKCQPAITNCSKQGCPAGYYCDLGSDKCLPGCAADEQCSGAKCNIIKHACCAAGESICSGACANTSTSTENCGGCGKMCSAPSGGHAVCNGGSCGVVCDGGRTLCDGQCVLTSSDVDHCGSCTTPCTQPTGGTVSCVNGKCTTGCPPTATSVCNGKCVDLSSDINNCQTCGTVCPSGGGTATCTAGKCGITCPTGKTLCTDTCVDVNTDINNCGYCGKTCPIATAGSSAATCTAGVCGVVCYSPASKCVDTCCDPTRYGGSHCCTSTDSYGKTFGYCLKSGYSCY